MRVAAIVIAACVVTGGCGHFLTPSGSAANRWAALEVARNARQQAAVSGDGQICKSMPVMGSNMPKKVCSTKEEWDEFDQQMHESVDAFDKDRKQGNTQGTFEN